MSALADLGARERDYLQAVVALAERRRRRRQRLVATGFALISTIALVIAFLAIRADRQAQRADQNAQRADRQAASARNASRLASASLHRSDPTLVLALVRDMEPRGALPPRWRELARWALRDKTARIWDLKDVATGTGAPIVLKGHDGPVATGAPGGGLSFSPDGARVLTISDDKALRIWNADGTGEPAILRMPEIDAYAAVFAPDGAHVVTTSHSERDPATGEMQYWATVWPSFERFTGLDDPALWTATHYCPPAGLRQQLLGEMPDDMAKRRVAACQDRVKAATRRNHRY